MNERRHAKPALCKWCSNSAPYRLKTVTATEGGRPYGFDLPPMYRVPPTKIENADAPFGGTSIELLPIGVEQPIPLAATIGEFLLGGGGSLWSPSAVRSACAFVEEWIIKQRHARSPALDVSVCWGCVIGSIRSISPSSRLNAALRSVRCAA